jgi:putative two-component system response regulator
VGKPRKILVVDDSKLLHKMYEVMLRGASLVFAPDGHEALARLAEHPDVDLVLLDLNMPRMNGFELLAALRASQVHAHVPVIIVSTEGKAADEARGLAAGALAYLRKPFTPEQLSEAIGRVRGSAPR